MKQVTILIIFGILCACAHAQRYRVTRPGYLGNNGMSANNFKEETIPLAKINAVVDTIIAIMTRDSASESLIDSNKFSGLAPHERNRLTAFLKSVPRIRLVDSLAVAESDGSFILSFNAVTCCLNFFDFKNDKCGSPCFTRTRMLSSGNGSVSGGSSDSYELKKIDSTYFFTGKWSPAIY